MFGGVVEPPRCKKLPKRDSNRQDIFAPSITPGYFAHVSKTYILHTDIALHLILLTLFVRYYV